MTCPGSDRITRSVVVVNKQDKKNQGNASASVIPEYSLCGKKKEPPDQVNRVKDMQWSRNDQAGLGLRDHLKPDKDRETALEMQLHLSKKGPYH